MTVLKEDVVHCLYQTVRTLADTIGLKESYTPAHQHTVSQIARCIGQLMNLERDIVDGLRIRATLHDFGIIRIPGEILNKPGRFEQHEMEIMKQHVLRGVEVLSTTTGLGDSYLRPALEHHERVDGTGYPHRRVRSELSQFGLIAAVVDIYDAMTSDRCYHKGKPPHEILQLLYRLSLAGHLDSTLVQQFIQVVGIYPVGSVVELNTGEIGIVKQINHETPLAPVVLLVKSAGNTILSHPEEQDLAQHTKTPGKNIKAVLAPQQAGIDPALYLDKKVA